jgi:hypothetical protein
VNGCTPIQFGSITRFVASPFNALLGFCTPGENAAATGCIVPTIPCFVENRFGGTVGGPVKKDKIWFFASTNIDRQRTGGQPSSSSPGIVPTPIGVTELKTAFPTSPVGLMQSTIGPNASTAGNPTFTNRLPRNCLLVLGRVDL